MGTSHFRRRKLKRTYQCKSIAGCSSPEQTSQVSRPSSPSLAPCLWQKRISFSLPKGGGLLCMFFFVQDSVSHSTTTFSQARHFVRKVVLFPLKDGLHIFKSTRMTIHKLLRNSDEEMMYHGRLSKIPELQHKDTTYRVKQDKRLRFHKLHIFSLNNP